MNVLLIISAFLNLGMLYYAPRLAKHLQQVKKWKDDPIGSAIVEVMIQTQRRKCLYPINKDRLLRDTAGIRVILSDLNQKYEKAKIRFITSEKDMKMREVNNRKNAKKIK